MIFKISILILVAAAVGVVSISADTKEPEVQSPKTSQKQYLEIKSDDIRKVRVLKEEINSIALRLTEIREKRNKIYLAVKDLTPSEAENPYYMSLLQEMDELDQEKLDLLQKMVSGMNEVSRAE